MKIMRKALTVLLALCLLSALAAPALAASYTYTVRIMAGAQGTIDDQEVVTYTGLRYGTRINFDINRIHTEEDSKYYVKGIRESGKDNGELSSPSILVTGDMDYVVAYGIKGNSVAYTVNYEDEEGNTLYPTATYYGNVGDKPVVAYQYIEGYLPQAYNLGKTLSENAADNVFTFTYSRVEVYTGTQEGGQTPGGEVTPPGPGGEIIEPSTPSTPSEPSGPLEDITEPTTPQASGPSQYEDLDDNDTPLAPGAIGEIIDTASNLSTPVKIAAVGGSASILGIAAWLLLGRKKKDDEDDNKEERE